MNFHFPAHRALCMAENATHNLHNLLTLRGALVRDPRVWARYLNEAIELFARGHRRGVRLPPLADLGHASVVAVPVRAARPVRLSARSDASAAEQRATRAGDRRGLIQLPPALEQAWHARGYYGSVSHNVKAIYQRYMGWFDGNPARCGRIRRQAAAKRYVDVIGGQHAVRDKARLTRTPVTCASPPNCSTTRCSPTQTTPPPGTALADVYERLGYGAENGTWRNFYLTGAAGTAPRRPTPGSR